MTGLCEVNGNVVHHCVEFAHFVGTVLFGVFYDIFRNVGLSSAMHFRTVGPFACLDEDERKTLHNF